MTRIIDFSIDGLSGRRKALHYKLEPDLNVFWGLNGSGKTSLLRILHSALSNDAAQLVRVPFKRAQVRFYSTNHDEVVTRTISKSPRQAADIEHFERVLSSHPDAARRTQEEWEIIRAARALSWDTAPSSFDASSEHGYLPISRTTERGARFAYRKQSRKDVQDEAAYDEAFADEIESLWQRYNSRALLQIREVQQQGLASILEVILNGASSSSGSIEEATAIDSERAYSLVTDFLRSQQLRTRLDNKSFNSRLRDDASLRSVVERIVRVTDRIAEAQGPQQRLQTLVSSLMSGEKSIEILGRSITIKSGETEIPVTGLSSGEKQLILILMECMAASGNSVIIDEPELSMHVDWQYRLLDAMHTVNPDAQVIVATHSPEVMAQIHDRNIFEL